MSHSPAASITSLINGGEMKKSARSTNSRRQSRIEARRPARFSASSMPSNPVMLSPSEPAMARPLRSSMQSKSAFRNRARAMASASPTSSFEVLAKAFSSELSSLRTIHPSSKAWAIRCFDSEFFARANSSATASGTTTIPCCRLSTSSRSTIAKLEMTDVSLTTSITLSVGKVFSQHFRRVMDGDATFLQSALKLDDIQPRHASALTSGDDFSLVKDARQLREDFAPLFRLLRGFFGDVWEISFDFHAAKMPPASVFANN